jgi:hypothetical protein
VVLVAVVAVVVGSQVVAYDREDIGPWAFLAEEDTYPWAFPAEACLATGGACLAGDNKGSFLVEAAAYAFQGKAVAASVRADNIERRRVAVASCRAWVDPGAEVSVRGAEERNFAVAVASVAVVAASVSGARDKVTS